MTDPGTYVKKNGKIRTLEIMEESTGSPPELLIYIILVELHEQQL